MSNNVELLSFQKMYGLWGYLLKAKALAPINEKRVLEGGWYLNYFRSSINLNWPGMHTSPLSRSLTPALPGTNLCVVVVDNNQLLILCKKSIKLHSVSLQFLQALETIDCVFLILRRITMMSDHQGFLFLFVVEVRAWDRSHVRGFAKARCKWIDREAWRYWEIQSQKEEKRGLHDFPIAWNDSNYNSRHCSLFLYHLLTIGYVSVKRSLSNFCISLIRINKLLKYCFYKFTRQLTIKDRLKRFQLFKTGMARYTVSVFQSVRVFNSLCVNHSP